MGTDLVKDVGEKSFIAFKQLNKLDNLDKNNSLKLDIDNKYKIYFYMKNNDIIYRLVFDSNDILVMNIETLEKKIPEEYKIKNDVEKVNDLIKHIFNKDLLLKTEIEI